MNGVCTARGTAVAVRRLSFLNLDFDRLTLGLASPRLNLAFYVLRFFTPHRLLKTFLFAALSLFWISHVARAAASDVAVNGPVEFRAAVAAAKPGTRILLAGGVYGGGFHFSSLRGEPGNSIVIAAANAAEPPVFCDANAGIHLSNPAHVELRDLVFTRLAQNGLNIDDGNTAAGPKGAHHITLRGLRISDIGGDGNNDGIKLSGVWDLIVSGCTIERWGTRGGSAVDMVGCHRGLIERNVIRHRSPTPPGCTGVQAKGGTSEVVIRRNHFENAGGRAVNLGGSTGLVYFRPALAPNGVYAEARDLVVEGNVFNGGESAVAFVGVDGAIVRFNTIDRPARWPVRILQETKAPGFVPSRRGQFTDNLIIVDSIRGLEVNVGAGTAPETFIFARNAWYNPVTPERSRPTLPTPEAEGFYGRDPAALSNHVGAAAFRESR